MGLAYNSEKFKDFSDAAITEHLPFPTTFLCKQIFSVSIVCKANNINKIDAEACIILVVSNIHL